MQLNEYSISQLAGVRIVQDVPPGTYSRMPLRPDVYMGIEIEGEEAHLPVDCHTSCSKLGWTITNDDSLRFDGVEFVLTAPLNGERLASSVSGLFALKRVGDVGWEDSPRSGTHFHLNVSDKNVGFVQAITALVYCVDELIFTLAGEDRKWCSYCNSLNTLPVTSLRSLLLNRPYERYHGWAGAWPVSARDRYYGFNLTSISKFGTVEFRYFPTPTEEGQVWEWMDLCQALYTIAEGFENEEDAARAVLDAITADPASILESLPMLAAIEGAVDSMKTAAEELDDTLSFDADHISDLPQATGTSFASFVTGLEARLAVGQGASIFSDYQEEF